MTPLVFIDTETDGLHPGRRAWEIGMIRRDDGGERECRMFLPLDLKYADPQALRVGGFWERHPVGRRLSGKAVAVDDSAPCCPTPEQPVTPVHDAAKKIMEWTFEAHLVGANPAFDAHVLDRLLRAEGYLPSWHYHLIDVEAMALGWLVAHGSAFPSDLIPWRSDALAGACGVEPAPESDRHTALGDARWVRDWYDRMAGETP